MISVDTLLQSLQEVSSIGESPAIDNLPPPTFIVTHLFMSYSKGSTSFVLIPGYNLINWKNSIIEQALKNQKC